MNAHADWLKARKQGLGGSDIAAVLGLSPWRTPLDVYLDKTGQTPDLEPNEAMHWGTVLEDVVARHYAETTGHTVQRVNTLLRHPKYDWMLANLDRAIVQPGSRARWDGEKLAGAEGVLEVKTASAYKADEWTGESLPVYYTTQVLWYMAVTSLPYADVAVLIGGNHYEQRRVEFDPELARDIRERCEAFWCRHVLAGLPPEPVNAADVVKLYPQDNGTLIEADADLLRLVGEARDIRARVKADEQALDSLTDAIKVRLGEATGLAVQGAPILTWKAAKGSRKTDWKSAFERVTTELGMSAEWIGDFVESATTSQPGSRRLLWKD